MHPLCRVTDNLANISDNVEKLRKWAPVDRARDLREIRSAVGRSEQDCLMRSAGYNSSTTTTRSRPL